MELNEEHIGVIINGCKKGDRKAQEQLYRSYYSSMMNLCLRYTKDEADAMSVLNTAFFKIFKNIQQYDPSKAVFYTWIRSVIINSCIDSIKTKQKQAIVFELSEAANVEVEAGVVTKMKAGEILNMVRLLPPATQAVFNLYVMEGYGHKEIGSLLGISEGTSKWHLSEARKNLQQQIKEEKKL